MNIKEGFDSEQLAREHPNVEQILYPTPWKGAATKTKPTCVGFLQNWDAPVNSKQ
ncbi:hypothetical protein [Rivularia sp. PCC 7116]|uniref:hypothetical protein n=1 Tax=Rivularia sp. PCC 7116 TaxID=373994 RepID=UPI0002DE3B32|nr:hypothetical protein [Rivularia sp. PCC 7116]